MQTDENQNVSNNQIKFLRFYDFSSDVRRILSTKSQHFLPSQTKANAKQNSLKITWRQHDNIWEWRATYSYVSSSNLFYSIHRQKKWCSKSWLTIFTSSSSATSLAPSFIVCIHISYYTLYTPCKLYKTGARCTRSSTYTGATFTKICPVQFATPFLQDSPKGSF